MAEEERIRQWRAQLAEEADSDDEGGGFGLAPPPGGMSGAPKHHDDDLGDPGLRVDHVRPTDHEGDVHVIRGRPAGKKGEQQDEQCTGDE